MRSKRPACSAPLIRSPISRLLGAPIGPVAADLFLLRRLDRRHIGPRHAGVAPLVARMSLAVRHHILGPVRLMLQERNSANAVRARRKRHDHRPPVAVTNQTGAHLIPAAYSAALRHPRVVGMPEP